MSSYYSLNGMKLIVPDSDCITERPLPQVLDTRFFYESSTQLGCAVIYECNSGTKRQSVRVWLFASKNPNLMKEKPVCEVVIFYPPFDGHVRNNSYEIHEGCPWNYDTLVNTYYRKGWI